MATLAGIVAACRARLESLDLRVSWCCSDRCAHNLLVRPRWFPPAQSADTGSELQSCSCKRVPTPGRLRQCCAGSCTRCVWGWARAPRHPSRTEAAQEEYHQPLFPELWSQLAVKR